MSLLKKLKPKKQSESKIPQLFQKLYDARNEAEVDGVIHEFPDIFKPVNWSPLGGNESNFGVVENQQSNPVAAIVEKLTNSIDAILMRKCYEANIDPKSPEAPRSVEEAMIQFFPEHKDWDLDKRRRQQAERIQILAHSLPRETNNTSLIIYDDGEGQHPEKFEETFLSLLRGNKNEIHFVQGKYNMGGSGAIVFCGKQRYQLIASKRYDGTGLFGFTLVRKHPLTEAEAQSKKNTWYEYLKIDGQIPAFPIDKLNLGLDRRTFRTGTIIKLYSYDLKGNRHIRRDLSRSLNEFLYEPALPILMVESAERYPNDKVLTGVVYGLKRHLEGNDYIEQIFSEIYTDQRIGTMKVTAHVFKARAKDKKAAETKETIQNEFFKNRMAVLFSVNGQVHGHYTSEFITRSLKYNLLRDHLLIHVDCTKMTYNFRSELFMASRDRLKEGEASKHLRQVLANNLKKGRLKEIYKQRKDKISVEGAEDDTLLKSLAENLPISSDLRQLLSQTFKLDQVEKSKKPKGKSTQSVGSASESSNKRPERGKKEKPERLPFNPQRFPTFFKLDVKEKGKRKVVRVPLNGSKTISFNSDVESQYFDRTEEAGDMKMAVLGYTRNNATGGNKKGSVNDISEIFNVTNRSPQEGTIKVVFEPNENVQVGDEVQIEVDLSSPGEEFSEIFWVQITEPLPKAKKEEAEPEEEAIGLPTRVPVYRDHPNEKEMTWEKLGDSSIEMDWDTVMHPLWGGEMLEIIYINMDSKVLKDYKSKIKNLTPEQKQLADRRYISAVYFHTLFLYVINKKRDYRIYKGDEGDKGGEVDLADYLKELFASHYAAFLMNFGTSELIEALG